MYVGLKTKKEYRNCAVGILTQTLEKIMLSEIVPKAEEAFKPFTLKLEVESIEEARLLFHMFNYTPFGNDLVKSKYIENGKYVLNFSRKPYPEIAMSLAVAITNQKFKL